MGANVPRQGDSDLQSMWGGFDTHCFHQKIQKVVSKNAGVA